MEKFTEYFAYFASFIFGGAVMYFFTNQDLYQVAICVLIWTPLVIRALYLSMQAKKLKHALAQVQQLADKNSEHFGAARKDISVCASETLKTM